MLNIIEKAIQLDLTMFDTILCSFLQIVRFILQNIRSAVMMYEPNEMRSIQRKLRSEYFPYGTKNWLIRVLLYSHHKIVGKGNGYLRKFLQKSVSLLQFYSYSVSYWQSLANIRDLTKWRRGGKTGTRKWIFHVAITVPVFTKIALKFSHRTRTGAFY